MVVFHHGLCAEDQQTCTHVCHNHPQSLPSTSLTDTPSSTPIWPKREYGPRVFFRKLPSPSKSKSGRKLNIFNHAAVFFLSSPVSVLIHTRGVWPTPLSLFCFEIPFPHQSTATASVCYIDYSGEGGYLQDRRPCAAVVARARHEASRGGRELPGPHHRH